MHKKERINTGRISSRESSNNSPLFSSGKIQMEYPQSAGNNTSRNDAFGNTAAKRQIMSKTYNVVAAGTGVSKDLQATKSHTTEYNRVYSDSTILQPKWNKVSETPWTAGAQVYGGYGRRVDRHTVSHEAPELFHIDAVQEHEGPTNARGAFFNQFKRAQTAPPKHHDTHVSDDAPDWFRLKKVVEYDPDVPFEQAPRYQKLLIGRTVVIEPESLVNFATRTNRRHANNMFS